MDVRLEIVPKTFSSAEMEAHLAPRLPMPGLIEKLAQDHPAGFRILVAS